MARVTIESCLKNKDISDKFSLVVIASFRAKSIESSHKYAVKNDTVEKLDTNAKNIKTPVKALREIEHCTICIQSLKDHIQECVKGKKQEISWGVVSNTNLSNNKDNKIQKEEEAFYIADSQVLL